MFRSESRLSKLLSRIADLTAVNLLTLVCCVPVITAGAALTAMYTCLFRLRENKEGYLYRDFFNAFKSNFKQATVMWLLTLLIFIMLIVDYKIFSGMSGASDILQILVLSAGIFIYMTVLYMFPMQAYFINPVKATVRNAFLTAVGRLPYTLAAGFLSILPFLLVYIVPVLFGLFFLLGLSGAAWINTSFFKKIFAAIPVTK